MAESDHDSAVSAWSPLDPKRARKAVVTFLRMAPDTRLYIMQKRYGMDTSGGDDPKAMMRHLIDTDQREAFLAHMEGLDPDER